MSVNLVITDRPVVFLKVSTTGINPKRDRIVELSLVKVEKDKSVKKGTRRFNPCMPIPYQATEIHGITDDMVLNSPKFSDVARDIYSFVDGCDFAGYNIEDFDLRFLIEEFNRAGIGFTLYGKNIINISNIYHSLVPRDMSAAYKEYCGKEIEVDVISTEQHNIIAAEILNGMMSKHNGQVYKDKKTGPHTIEANPSFLSNHFRRHKKALDLEGKVVLGEDGRPVFNFSQYKGQPVADAMLANFDYYEWLINHSEIPSDSKQLIKRIVEKANASKTA
jgi:DNA polymerase-3 subunit epsilon